MASAPSWRHGSHATVSQIKEKFDGLRVYVAPIDEYEEGGIDFAEEASFRICEVTEHPGRFHRLAGDRLSGAGAVQDQ